MHLEFMNRTESNAAKQETILTLILYHAHCALYNVHCGPMYSESQLKLIYANRIIKQVAKKPQIK